MTIKTKKKIKDKDIVKNIEIVLERNPCNSKVLIDGKILPVKKVEIVQSMDDLLEATLYIFPNKVTILRDKMVKEK